VLQAPRLRRLLPFLDWPRVTATSARADLIAGVTVALVAIPQALAYAQLAGVPLQYGLYAAFIPALIGVLWGSSAILSTGPVAMTSLLTAASVGALVAPRTEDFYAYVTLLALLSGLFQLGFGLARAGFLLSLVSHPVLMGFINAAALIIALSQFPSLIGISAAASKSLLADTWHVLLQIDAIHGLSMVFGVAAILLFLAFRRYAPKWPGVLITVALLTAASYALGFAERGGRVVGSIPAGLPAFGVPLLDWSAARALLPAAFVIALLSFMEAVSSAKVIALRRRTGWDENQELIGQGLAKVAASFCQSMPVSGSFSRSALNLAANAQTGWSAVVCAAMVLLTLLFFTPLLYHLPKPVLAAMIMLAVANLIDLGALKRAWLASREDGIAGTATFVATLAFAPYIQNGIVAGILISLVAFIYGRMRPRVQVVAVGEHGALHEVARGVEVNNAQVGIGALRFDASLYFANVSFFEEAVLALERSNPGIRFILIVAGSINSIDASGAEMLRSLADRLRQNGVTLVLGGPKQQIMDVAERTGLVTALGHANVYPTEHAAAVDLIARLKAAER
jgi:SulP family sulfate permease